MNFQRRGRFNLPAEVNGARPTVGTGRHDQVDFRVRNATGFDHILDPGLLAERGSDAGLATLVASQKKCEIAAKAHFHREHDRS